MGAYITRELYENMLFLYLFQRYRGATHHKAIPVWTTTNSFVGKKRVLSKTGTKQVWKKDCRIQSCLLLNISPSNTKDLSGEQSIELRGIPLPLCYGKLQDNKTVILFIMSIRHNT